MDDLVLLKGRASVKSFITYVGSYTYILSFENQKKIKLKKA